MTERDRDIFMLGVSEESLAGGFFWKKTLFFKIKSVFHYVCHIYQTMLKEQYVHVYGAVGLYQSSVISTIPP